VRERDHLEQLAEQDIIIGRARDLHDAGGDVASARQIAIRQPLARPADLAGEVDVGLSHVRSESTTRPPG
jgi:hypothetical protein